MAIISRYQHRIPLFGPEVGLKKNKTRGLQSTRSTEIRLILWHSYSYVFVIYFRWVKLLLELWFSLILHRLQAGFTLSKLMIFDLPIRDFEHFVGPFRLVSQIYAVAILLDCVLLYNVCSWRVVRDKFTNLCILIT